VSLESLSYPGRKPSKLAMGCEQLGGTDWGSIDISLVRRAVQRAWEVGITVFDTADVYGLGKSEEELCKALGRHRFDAFIITKFGVAWNDGNGQRAKTYFDSSPKHLAISLENSLRRLQIEAIPLYMVHWPDPKVNLSDTLEVLEKLRDTGKILNFGLSNFQAADIQEYSSSYSISSFQGSFNLLDWRDQEQIFKSAKEKNLACFSYGPLAQGLLSGKYDQDHEFASNDRRNRLKYFKNIQWGGNQNLIEKLKTIASKYQKDIAQCAIRWILDSQTIDAVIIGAKTAEQIDSNMNALGWQLSKEDFNSLKM
jgi:aryl-alcohol dehydrogenase-like predicted oxidoreductase